MGGHHSKPHGAAGAPNYKAPPPPGSKAEADALDDHVSATYAQVQKKPAKKASRMSAAELASMHYIKQSDEAKANPAEKQPWYRMDLSRDDATEVLRGSSADSYLVRKASDPTTDGADDYVLCCNVGDRIFSGKLTSIMNKDKRYLRFCKTDRAFADIYDIIKFCSTTTFTRNSAGKPYKLDMSNVATALLKASDGRAVRYHGGYPKTTRNIKLESQPWFKPSIARGDVDELVKTMKKGEFLIRGSSKDYNNDGKPDYVLVACTADGTSFQILLESHLQPSGETWYKFATEDGPLLCFPSLIDIVICCSKFTFTADDAGAEFMLAYEAPEPDTRLMYHRPTEGVSDHDLEEQHWYRPKLNRIQAGCAIAASEPGSFLVREADRDYNDDGFTDFVLTAQVGEGRVFTGLIESHERKGVCWFRLFNTPHYLSSVSEIVAFCAMTPFLTTPTGAPFMLNADTPAAVAPGTDEVPAYAPARDFDWDVTLPDYVPPADFEEEAENSAPVETANPFKAGPTPEYTPPPGYDDDDVELPAYMSAPGFDSDSDDE